ncbi:MAG: substrate-binding periplasmic protein [Thalassotalea sp.]
MVIVLLLLFSPSDECDAQMTLLLGLLSLFDLLTGMGGEMKVKYSFITNVICALLSLFSLFSVANQFNNNNDTIVVATHTEPPLVYIKEGEFIGRNVEIAKVLAASIGKKVSFIHCPFARCLSMTKAGKADMMVAINRTEARMAYLDYLAKPFSTDITPVRFYVKADSKLMINKYEDLKGLTVGVLRGAFYFKEFQDDISLNKVEITTHGQLIEMLIKGRIDITLAREISIKSRVPADVYNHKLKLMPYIYNKKNDFYIAVSKKSAAKIDVQKLSHNLDQLLANGEIEKLLKQ